MTVTVEIPMRLPSLANISFGHWAKKAKVVKQQRDVVTLALWLRAPEFVQVTRNGVWVPAGSRVVVMLVRCAPRKLDSDNLQGAFKHVRDSVAVFLGVDDGREDLVRFEYAQEKAKQPLVRISFRVETDEQAVSLAKRLRETP